MSGPKTAKKPMRLHKGLLFFALACAQLWGSMWLSRGPSLSLTQAKSEHTYELGSEAWQGIDRVALQGVSSRTITLSAQQRPHLLSRNDNSLQPRLALKRQGNTLLIEPQAEEAQQDEPARSRRTEVAIEKLVLPWHVQTISSETSLDIHTDEADKPKQNLSPSLTLIGQSIRFNGDIPHLQVQLTPRTPAAACGTMLGWAAHLSVNSKQMQTLDITAPNHSKIALKMGADKAQSSTVLPPKITLKTGANSQLELGSVGLLEHLQHQPVPADSANCAPAPASSADAPAADGSFDSTQAPRVTP